MVEIFIIGYTKYIAGDCIGLVLFLDMDYFFAACEELRHPELKSKPFVVGTATIAKRERGVVQTCNYEARKFGIHSAMPTMKALQLKPDLVYLESDEEYYEETSKRVMALLKGYGLPIEIVSIDEAALDIGEMNPGKAMELAKVIKKTINDRIGLPCTIGISIGRNYAKMICDDSKPNGIGMLIDGIKDYLSSKSVDAILGVGRKTSERLKLMGIERIGQLADANPNTLAERFGVFGRELYLLANGTDNSKVMQSTETLSVGRERTLERETKAINELDQMLAQLSNEVIKELNKQGLWFRGVSVKARYSDFTERIKNRKLNSHADSYDVLYSTSRQLVKELLDEKYIRKVGVRAYMLEQRKMQKKLL